MNESLLKVRSRIKLKSARVQAFMLSDVGKEVIKAMEDEFYHGELFDADPLKTTFNLGRRDLVVFMKQLQNWGTEDE